MERGPGGEVSPIYSQTPRSPPTLPRRKYHVRSRKRNISCPSSCDAACPQDCGDCPLYCGDGDCHAQAGLGGSHGLHLAFSFSCSACHSVTVNAAGQIIAPDKHVNCTKDVSGSFTWSGGTCSSVMCHGNKAW